MRIFRQRVTGSSQHDARHVAPAVMSRVARGGTRSVALTVVLAAMAACKGSETKSTETSATGGTVVISTSTDADYLFPPLYNSSAGRQVTEQLFEPLADMGDAMNTIGEAGFIPRLADRWEWGADSLSIAFHLNPKARWHDGKPVRASDVRFTERLYKDSALASPQMEALTEIDSVSVRDSLTPVVWLKHKSPRAFYTAASTMLIMPEHVYGTVKPAELATSDILRKPVGSGPFKFSRWAPNAALEIVANTDHYRKRAMLDRVIWTVAPGDFATAAARLMSGDADFFEALRPEMIAQAAQLKSIRVQTFSGLDYAMLLFNERDRKSHAKPHPLFSDKALRRALTMGVDRVGIVKNVFDSLAAPALGPMVRAMPTTDTTLAQIPYDTTAARALLDSLGWRDTDNTGVRKKDGKPLAFTVLTPTSSKNRERCAVLIQEQLRKIGVKMDIEPMEMATFLQRSDARDYDGVMMALHLDGNPASVKQTWGTAEAAKPNGSNYATYVNPLFDAQVDSAMALYSPEETRAAFSKAMRTIIADVPAIWLYDLKGAVGVHKRIRLAPLRPDAWWAHLSEWSIPADQRIARDAPISVAGQ